jgi:hypothetical protein
VIEKGSEANFVIHLGLSDHLVANGDDDAIDDLRGGKGDQEYEGDKESRYRATTVRE